MRETRTRLQIDANQFDVALYRLIERAADLADKHAKEPFARSSWGGVRSLLLQARSSVKLMMHKQDAKETN